MRTAYARSNEAKVKDRIRRRSLYESVPVGRIEAALDVWLARRERGEAVTRTTIHATTIVFHPHADDDNRPLSDVLCECALHRALRMLHERMAFESIIAPLRRAAIHAREAGIVQARPQSHDVGPGSAAAGEAGHDGVVEPKRTTTTIGDMLRLSMKSKNGKEIQ